MGNQSFIRVQKPKVADIARVAGVSLATVDRVLNARPGVRRVTIEKVNKAIADLGYVRDAAAASLARRRFRRLLFILPDTPNEFICALEQQVTEQGKKLLHERMILETQFVAPFDPLAAATALDGLDAEDVDGVAIFGPETAQVCKAVERARTRGIAVVSLVANLPSSDQDYFVGIDNTAAGRTAAQLMARFIGGLGDVLVITGSHLARDHLERRAGFEEVVSEHYPNVALVASLEGQDDADLIEKALPELFETHPNISGIYACAAGNPGLIRFLSKNTWYRDIVVVAHELTASSGAALKSGVFDAIIAQDTGHLVRSAVRLLKASVDRLPIDRTQEPIRIDIYLKENMPPV